jgi:hypothetical protein
MTNRITPNVDPQHYQTFQIKAPVNTHWRKATCEEVACLFGEKGWTTTVDESTDLGQRQAHYIRTSSGRKFKESRNELGLTVFEFASGQPCFREHKARLDRQELYVVKGGDWRGNPARTPARVHTKPEFWVEEFAENQEHIKNLRERG